MHLEARHVRINALAPVLRLAQVSLLAIAQHANAGAVYTSICLLLRVNHGKAQWLCTCLHSFSFVGAMACTPIETVVHAGIYTVLPTHENTLTPNTRMNVPRSILTS
jgi:hypothetical protein